MIVVLRCFFVLVFLAMTWATVTASLDRDVLTAAAEIWADPWGRATLFDTYFAFLTVWLVIAARERRLLPVLGWLVGILTLGSFTIAAYFLLASWRLPAGSPWWRIVTPADSASEGIAA